MKRFLRIPPGRSLFITVFINFAWAAQVYKCPVLSNADPIASEGGKKAEQLNWASMLGLGLHAKIK